MESGNGGYKREFEQVLKMSNILQNKQKRDIVFHDDIAKFKAINSGAQFSLFGLPMPSEKKEQWEKELRPYDTLWQIFENIDNTLEEIQRQLKQQQEVLNEYIKVQSNVSKLLDENFAGMLQAFEESVKSNEELATQSEAQYLAVKRKLEELNTK